jgi:hypothetical protein
MLLILGKVIFNREKPFKIFMIVLYITLLSKRGVKEY